MQVFGLIFSGRVASGLINSGHSILYETIGTAFVATIIAAALTLISLPYLSAKIPGAQKAWSKATDERVKLVAGVLRHIKAIKMSA